MTQRLRIVIRGAVQGVGFRPSMYRLARALRLTGWVSNSPQGVFLEVEGEKNLLDSFLLRIEREKPPRAVIQSIEPSYLDPAGFSSFEIRESETLGVKTTIILPDIATCKDCKEEIFDPANRRYRYPFTNCTNCGPRYSITESLPYDRPNTSMKAFTMCPECRREYADPADRRFHAQPNACPVCGPRLELWCVHGWPITSHDDAIGIAVERIRQGAIVALKGIGGFHLIADARNAEAVQELRERKHRDEKPFAVMFPTLEAVKDVCEVSPLEERLLSSPESPIVLLKRKSHAGIRNPKSAITSSVAPGNPMLGVMLPYSPLHLILMHDLGFPVVATSGNIADEPICIDEHEAVKRLRGIADIFLVHNRPIIRHIDDSVARVLLGREQVLRRSRGYAPLPITTKTNQEQAVLAVGGHLKNTVALANGNSIVVSQHIGDLETPEALGAFERVVVDLQKLYDTKPVAVICDLHPDYGSSRRARELGIDVVEVQHHYAHIAACMAENQLDGEVLGVSWDGTGLGLDNTIWGGEFLLTTQTSFARVASFRPFRLPGGEAAVKEPRRTAFGLLYEMFEGNFPDTEKFPTLKQFSERELVVLHQMLRNGVNVPLTTSAGRLFDAVASLSGVRQRVNFEGQAAMELELLATQVCTDERYEFGIQSSLSAGSEPGFLLMVDWSPMIFEILFDLQHKISTSMIAAKFHNTLAEMILQVAQRVKQPRVVLSGGCFQNRYLTERVVRILEQHSFRPYWHQRIPPNDGGIALGQIAAFQRQSVLTRNELHGETLHGAL